MLDFYLIADEQADYPASGQLRQAGGIGDEEFELAQQLGLIESHADYYGDFRWSSQQVRQKVELLAHCPMRGKTALHDILNQAQSAGTGLLALGD